MDRYKTFMQAMKKAFRTVPAPFVNKEQMLFYHICQPDDAAAKNYVMSLDKDTLTSYTRKDRNPRGIALKINHFSANAFSQFLYDYDQGNLFHNPYRWELVDALSELVVPDDYEGDVFMYCANEFVSILEEAKHIEDGRTQKTTKASCPEHSDDVNQDPSSEAARTNIYNQTLFYTNCGSINVIGHVDHLEL